LIDVILRDGTTETVTAGEALAIGADPKVVGSKVLADMLADLD
jgi:hypothetical protein